MVEYAKIRFKSFCVSAMVAAIKAVKQPIQAINVSTSGLNRSYTLPNKNIPAATMVAACINADIDVGPSIASGSQVCSGNCADLAIAPIKKHIPGRVIHVLSAALINAAVAWLSNKVTMLNV